MSDLSQDQDAMRASIQKSATIWGVIAGVIVGLIAIWILGGQGSAVRFGGGIVIGAVVAFLAYRASFKSNSKAAECAKCGAAFSRSRSDRAETLASSTPKEEREEMEDKSKKVTTWTEEVYDVIDSYTCAKCQDVTTKVYQTTRRKEEETTVYPYEPPAPSGKTAADGGKSARARSSRGGKGDAG